MPHVEFLKQPTDELLEEIWTLRERGESSVEQIVAKSTEDEARVILDRLVAGNWIQITNGIVELSVSGEERARLVVRSHRLAERLLCDVLEVSNGEANRTACLMEHVLSPKVTEAVCGFLGHPPTSPHGKPIPPGACCTARAGKDVPPIVVPLDQVNPGRTARIVFIAPGIEARIERLASFGVVPGTEIELRQKRPSCVVEVGGTTLALENDVARGIYVRRDS